jgi:hypothetical protein
MWGPGAKRRYNLLKDFRSSTTAWVRFVISREIEADLDRSTCRQDAGMIRIATGDSRACSERLCVLLAARG